MNKKFYALFCLIAGFSFLTSSKNSACSLDYVSDGATQVGFSSNGVSFKPSNNDYFHVGAGFAPLPSALGSTGFSDLKITYISAFTFQNLACNTNCNFRNVVGGKFYYRVFKTSAGASGIFNEISLSLSSENMGTNCATQYHNKTYAASPNADLLIGLEAGTNYTLQMYYEAFVDITGDSTADVGVLNNGGGSNINVPLVRNNGGAYFSTTFTTATTLDFKPKQTPQYLEENSKDVVIFPNPASDKAFLKLKDFDNAEINLLIINSLGMVVRQKMTVVLHETPIEVDLADLPAGLYFVKIMADDRREKLKRLVVRH